MTTTTYTCECCGKTFEDDRTHEQASQAAEKRFGKPVEEWKEGIAVVCSKCFEMVMSAFTPQELERFKKDI